MRLAALQCPPAEAFRAAEALLEDTAALAEAHTGADLSSFRQALAQRRRPLDPPPAGR
jgi:predicted phage-related endonuclease